MDFRQSRRPRHERDFAAAFLYPAGAASTVSSLESQLPKEGVWLSSWETLGASVLATVKQNLWKLLLPMAASSCFRSGWLSRAGGRFFEPGRFAVERILPPGGDENLRLVVERAQSHGAAFDSGHGRGLQHFHATGLAPPSRQPARGAALGWTRLAAVRGDGHRRIQFARLSSNAGMASLGRVCAVGIAGNVLLSCWRCRFGGRPLAARAITPFALAALPRAVVASRFDVGTHLPLPVAARWPRIGAAFTGDLAWRRREIVMENLRPVAGDGAAARRGRAGVVRAIRAQAGRPLALRKRSQAEELVFGWQGWEHFTAAHARGKGVLLVTPHLGNWEFGGAFLVEKGYRLLVLTQAEPDAQLTKIRQASRARWGVETLVVGDDPFAIVEIIKCLQAGAAVALLVDRPPAPTAVTVELFGRPFSASIAAAELARASGCAILPVVMVRRPDGYSARISPEIPYDRAAIGDRAGRIRLTQQIVRAFEPAYSAEFDPMVSLRSNLAAGE
jgi:lauroyl/myristoyl acyltransferase